MVLGLIPTIRKYKQKFYKLFNGNWLKTRSPGHVRQTMDQSIHICSIIHALIIILYLHLIFILSIYEEWLLFENSFMPLPGPIVISKLVLDSIDQEPINACVWVPHFATRLCTFSLSVKFKDICLSSSKENANG